jgi:hypothetical protein
MGLRPTQGDEKLLLLILLRANRSVIPTGAKRSGGTCCSSSAPSNLNGSTTPPFVVPSEVEGSAVASSIETAPNGSTTLPFVIPTGAYPDSCHTALDKAACAPFGKGKAHEVHQRHKVPQEIRGSAVEGSAVQLPSDGHVFQAPAHAIPSLRCSCSSVIPLVSG